MSARKATGIEARPGPRGTRYRASVWSGPDRKLIRKTFDSLAEAKRWRVDAAQALQHGTLRPPSSLTVEQAAEAWLEGARDGTVRNRSGHAFKPSTVRGYERALRLRVHPTLGPARLSDVHRRDVQDLVDRLLRAGHTPSTVRNSIDPLRSIFRRAVRREDVAVNPMHDLEVPADLGRRERVATPAEARALLAALPAEDRPFWAAAFYTGMRRGELRQLRWSHVDLGASVIVVDGTYDDGGEIVAAKTAAGMREVPILSTLATELLEHKLRTGRGRHDLVFGRTASDPFVPSTLRRRALDAWEAAGLKPISPHECRHTAATEMRAAGLDFKMIQTIIGHSSVTTTFDRYTHVSRDHLRSAGEQLDAHYATREELGKSRPRA
jgi:integrase